MKAWRRGRHGLSDKEAVQGFISANTCAFFYMGYLCLFRSAGKESPCNAGDPRLIRGLGRSPGEGIGYPLQYSWASLVAQMVKNLPVMRRPGFDPWLGKIPWRRAWQPTPVFLPGRSPWTKKPGRLQFMGSKRVRHDWVTKHSVPLTQWTWIWANSKRWWRTEEPGVLQSMGSQSVRQDWVIEQQQCSIPSSILIPRELSLAT